MELQGVEVYELASHVEQVVHFLSLVVVGAIDWYWLLPHDDQVEQMVSDEPVQPPSENLPTLQELQL